MPIRADLRRFYGPDWDEISHRIRFERAKGRCERCKRPHRRLVLALPDGRWLDPSAPEGWRGVAGAPVLIPRTDDLWAARMVRVVLTTAHLDHDPANRAECNLQALCQRCHLRHDLQHHQANRRITLRSRAADADLFEGPYGR